MAVWPPYPGCPGPESPGPWGLPRCRASPVDRLLPGTGSGPEPLDTLSIVCSLRSSGPCSMAAPSTRCERLSCIQHAQKRERGACALDAVRHGPPATRGATRAYACCMFKRRRMPKWTDGSLWCSFCGKQKNEVEKVIAGPGVSICNECVDSATRSSRRNGHRVGRFCSKGHPAGPVPASTAVAWGLDL